MLFILTPLLLNSYIIVSVNHSFTFSFLSPSYNAPRNSTEYFFQIYKGELKGFLFSKVFLVQLTCNKNGIYIPSSRHKPKLHFTYINQFSGFFFNNSLKHFYRVFQQFQVTIVPSLCCFTFVLKAIYGHVCPTQKVFSSPLIYN